MHHCDDSGWVAAKKMPAVADLTYQSVLGVFQCSRFVLVPKLRFYLDEVATLIQHLELVIGMAK
jgi:hypothetical protein